MASVIRNYILLVVILSLASSLHWAYLMPTALIRAIACGALAVAIVLYWILYPRAEKQDAEREKAGVPVDPIASSHIGQQRTIMYLLIIAGVAEAFRVLLFYEQFRVGLPLNWPLIGVTLILLLAAVTFLIRGFVYAALGRPAAG